MVYDLSRFKKKTFSVSFYPKEYDRFIDTIQKSGYKHSEFILASSISATEKRMASVQKKVVIARKELRKEEKELKRKQKKLAKKQPQQTVNLPRLTICMHRVQIITGFMLCTASLHHPRKNTVLCFQ